MTAEAGKARMNKTIIKWTAWFFVCGIGLLAGAARAQPADPRGASAGAEAATREAATRIDGGIFSDTTQPATEPGEEQSAPGPVTPASEVEFMIRQAVAFLYSKQNPQGNWERVGEAANPNHVWDINHGGTTALSLYALLAAGEPYSDPRIRRGVEWMMQAEMKGVYAVAMRLNGMWYLPRNLVRDRVRDDVSFLLRSQIRLPGKAAGHYGYTEKTAPDVTDHSVSQVAVLGMWMADRMGQGPSDDYWKRIETAWLRDQQPSGGWSYRQRPQGDFGVDGSMTAAGVATLFISQEYLHADKGLACKGNITNAGIESGLAWMREHFATAINPGTAPIEHQAPFYWLYGVERCGVASGRKYFGRHNWFNEGVKELRRSQLAEGSFPASAGPLMNEIHNTSFALIFLARGRQPVLINKLQYPGTWNQRPRDAANFTRWYESQFEREFNWQVVGIHNHLAELHDAPVLLISGGGALGFTPTQREKLKQYVLGGGLVLGIADCQSVEFSRSFAALAEGLFPGESMRVLPRDHPIMKGELPLSGPVEVQALGNGLREMFLLIPQQDPGRAWQAQGSAEQPALFQIGAGILRYASGREDLRYKHDAPAVIPDPSIHPSMNVRLARIEHPGMWNPEPGGWSRVAGLLHNQNGIELTWDAVALADPALSNYSIAHMTGTQGFRIMPDERKQIMAFIAKGGTLLVDAAGGSPEFARSAEIEFGNLVIGGRLQPIRSDDPLLAPTIARPAAGGENTKPRSPDAPPAFDPPPLPGELPLKIAYRRAARSRIGKLDESRLQGVRVGRRWAIILSDMDLSCGLSGSNADGVAGYSPSTALEIVRRVIRNTAKSK